MTDYSGKIIGMVISLLLAGILLPIGLTDIVAFNSTNPTIETLVGTVLPIMAVIGLVMLFVSKKTN